MEQARILKIIWASFMISIAVFQVVLFVTAPEGAFDLNLLATVGAMATSSAAFGLVGVPTTMRSAPAQTSFIMRFACFESVALFGFVGGFVTGLPAVSLVAAVAAWGLMLSVFPTDERFTAWEVRRLGETDP